MNRRLLAKILQRQRQQRRVQMLDHHSTCAECQKVINTIIQKHKIVNGRLYHTECWDKKVKRLEKR